MLHIVNGSGLPGSVQLLGRGCFFFSQCNTQVPSTQVNLCYVENANLNQMILAYNY